MSNQHILSSFDHAIRTLREEVLAMGDRARHNLERAMQSLLERNSELANMVIADDDEVDESEMRIDRLGMDMLVRFHPVATDLRMVISSMRISVNLERIADHATSIAKRARKINNHAELADVNLVEPLYRMAYQLLSEAITAYAGHDSSAGASLATKDKELDRMHKAINVTLGKRLESGTGRSEDYLHLVFVVRSLERIGDLSVNIGEDTVYLEEARDIRHDHGQQPGN
jgi:phosphate transport system protein